MHVTAMHVTVRVLVGMLAAPLAAAAPMHHEGALVLAEEPLAFAAEPKSRACSPSGATQAAASAQMAHAVKWLIF